jgi:hypothetical protein
VAHELCDEHEVVAATDEGGPEGVPGMPSIRVMVWMAGWRISSQQRIRTCP